MFAHQRESDEDVDEDDMTIGELQRIKEMTSSGSDLETDTESTFEERKEKEETTDQNTVCSFLSSMCLLLNRLTNKACFY